MSPRALPALFVASLLTIETSFAPVAQAQDAVSVEMPDEVLLKDGSMFRGTITEIVPSDHVDLLLPSRQTRRFAFSDVTYAGAAAGAPGTTPKANAARGAVAPATPRPRQAEVDVTANIPDVQLLTRVGQGTIGGMGYGFHGGGFVFSGNTKSYAILCTAPCNLELPIGEQRFALSHAGGAALEMDDPIGLSGSGTLRATYESRRAVRLWGLAVLLAGVAAGTTLLFLGRSTTSCAQGVYTVGAPCEEVEWRAAYLATGAVVLIGGTITGLIMMLTGDKASIDFVPTMTSKRLAPRGGAADSHTTAPADSYGMSLRLAF